MATSIGLLRYQGDMLKTIFNIAKNSLKTLPLKPFEHKLKVEVNNIIPSTKIINEYQQWLNLKDKNNVPSHLFPLWSYPHLFKLGSHLNLPLHKVLNQGCKLKINSELPINSPLNMKAEIYDVKELGSKYRVNQRITTSSKHHEEAVVAEVYAVILKEKMNTSALSKKSIKPINTDNLTLINELKISKKDAQSYAFLSGDINPIHLSHRIAKAMGLQGRIMHGFGLFAIIFEKLREADIKFSEIDVRFLQPVYLEENISIYIEKAQNGKTNLKVLGQNNTQLHLSGFIK